MNKYKWYIAILIALVILITGLYIYDRYYFYTDETQTQPIIPNESTSSFIKADHYVHALIVNMSSTVDPRVIDLYNGEDALIAIHKNIDPLRHDDDVFADIPVMLAMFDQNKDGRIDAHDAIFSQLELIFFNKPNGSWQYVPVSQAGIRAIYVDPKYYNKIGLQLPVGKPAYPAGTVIMADSTARLVRDVMLDGEYLQKQISGR